MPLRRTSRMPSNLLDFFKKNIQGLLRVVWEYKLA